MKNKFLVTCLTLTISFLLCTGSSLGQTLHSIIFSYSEDEKIGPSCFEDYRNFRSEIRTIADGISYDLAEYHFSQDFNKESFINTLNNLSVQSEDIIILYITSHGARSAQDDNQFPQIVVPGSEENFSAYRTHQSLVTSYNPKLSLTIVDACNNYANISPKEITVYGKTYERKGLQMLSENEKNNYIRLFKNYTGSLIVSSSQEGVSSIATSKGSTFTNSFLQSLRYYVLLETSNESLVNWDNLLVRAQQYTLNESERIAFNNTDFNSHYPVWENNTLESAQTIVSEAEVIPPSIELVHSTKLFTDQEKLDWGTNNPYMLSVWIEGSSSDLDMIESVTYFYHHTFVHPVSINTNVNEKFKERTDVWGQFWLRARINFKDGTETELSRYTSFD